VSPSPITRIIVCIATVVFLAIFSPFAKAHAQMYGEATEPPLLTDVTVATRLINQRKIHEHFQRGLAAEAQGNWQTAVNEFASIPALSPSKAQLSTTWYDLGLAQAHLGLNRQALNNFNQALALDPQFAAAAANAVVTALHTNDAQGARVAARRFSTIAPRSVLARYDSGLAALKAGRDSEARSIFDALLVDDASLAIVGYNLAVIDIRAKDFLRARDELKRTLIIAPHYSRARLAMGFVLIRLGRRLEARDMLLKCMRETTNQAIRESAQAVLTELQ
jgi:tetratricopeptide (TPR) repeat protein